MACNTRYDRGYELSRTIEGATMCHSLELVTYYKRSGRHGVFQD